ncbi:hypothetical protein KUW09_04000 [Mameliella alba]|nr:hypothetical protein [Antarctobacter heliothermus]MBY6143190.1 hypothetical protein [Mameliella alba]MCA0953086.1 hypothetical protein [Mameliella alba]
MSIFPFSRFIRLWTAGPIWIVAVFLCLSSAVPAATVQEGAAPCDFTLDGSITAGDFDKLAAFRTNPDTWYKDGLYWEPTLCLNSPGGSLSEGAKIARFVYDTGLQTRIGNGSACYSVCAIIFMMGNKHSGPTTVEETRTLHIGGDLAFHSPSITIDGSQSYGADELRLAYELGVESILNIVELANLQRRYESGAMMHPGLIGALLDTPANQLFHITTIEQALSWDIGLEGVPEHLPQMDVQRLMTCENALSRGYRRPSEIYGGTDNHFLTADVFALAPLSTTAQYRLFWDYQPEDLDHGLVFSFRYWDLPVECRVKLDNGKVEVCGFDSRFQLEIGDCQSDRFVRLPHYARYHPQTEFRTLDRTGISADILRAARCSWRSVSGATLREEACTQAIDMFQRADRKFARHTLHWPNGERTVVEIATKPGFGIDDAIDIFRVDGEAAEPVAGMQHCLMLPRSGQSICVSEAQ